MWLRVGSGPDEGMKALVEGEVFTVGSGADAHFRLSDDGVARAHAFFKTLSDGRIELHDLGSPGGTFVNGEGVEGSVLLLGDEDVRVGSTVLVLSLGDPDAADPEPGGASEPAADHFAESPPPEPAAPVPGEPVPARTRRIYSGRAAVAYLRQMRKTVRRALALAAAAVAAALVLFVLVLSGAIGGGDDGIETEEIVDSVTDSTVVIRASDDAGRGGGGSGWVLDADEGLIVTNFHVINGATNVEAGPPDDIRRAEVVAAAPCEDLAVLRVRDTDGLEELSLGSQEGIDQGERVVAVGYPANASLEEQLTATQGVVSVTESDLKPPTPDAPRFSNVIQTDASLNPGNSGGPLVNADRELIGVNTAVLTELGGQPIQGQGYAIGVDRVKEIVEPLREGESSGWLGGGLLVLPAAERRKRDLPPGVVIVGPAAGLELASRRELLLTGVNGARVQDMASYCSAAGDAEGGQQASLMVVTRPGGRPREVPAEFE
jgi:S1-C subfamily serine protease